MLKALLYVLVVLRRGQANSRETVLGCEVVQIAFLLEFLWLIGFHQVHLVLHQQRGDRTVLRIAIAVLVNDLLPLHRFLQSLFLLGRADDDAT